MAANVMGGTKSVLGTTSGTLCRGERLESIETSFAEVRQPFFSSPLAQPVGRAPSSMAWLKLARINGYVTAVDFPECSLMTAEHARTCPKTSVWAEPCPTLWADRQLRTPPGLEACTARAPILGQDEEPATSFHVTNQVRWLFFRRTHRASGRVAP